MEEKVGNKEGDQPKVLNFTGEEYLEVGEIAKPFWEQGVTENLPKFVIYMGGVGSGKTTMRRHHQSSGYVHFDFGEICIAMEKGFGKDNPKLPNYELLAGSMILQESVEAKKNIVIEIIGDDEKLFIPVIKKMKEIGYETSLQFIACKPEDAYGRHLKAVEEDKDYISSFYTQEATLSFFYEQLQLGKMPEAVEKDKKYLVKVDDNFHPMDTGEAYDDKTYSSLEEAVKRCKEITIDSLMHSYKKGINASELLEQWMAFGDDPFVYTGEGDLPFSARDFVTEELCLYIIKEMENIE